MNPLLTPGIDVALLVFWAFVLFFIGLVFYLRREDRREGYPVENELTGRIDTPGGPLYLPAPKTFKLPFGHGSVTVPRRNDVQPVDIAARRMERSGGSPMSPTGNPLVDGIGPAAWANRADVPDIDMHGHPRSYRSRWRPASASRARIRTCTAGRCAAPTVRSRAM
jgi:photosynthetic reaction center H subunit